MESRESLPNDRSTAILIHSEDLPAKSGKELRQRDSWTGKFDFLLACTGTAVGLGNVWRFPYLCYKNGGGAFLIPYLIMVAFSGIPLFFLEVALGQFTKLGAIKAWNGICPLLSGVGLSTIAIVFYTMCYYAVILAWALFYLFQSWRSVLPWSTCNNTWNTPACQSDFTTLMGTNVTTSEANLTSPVIEYWEREVLQISDGIHDIGGVRWELAGVLLLAWFICYIAVFKGAESTGKTMYFTATFPYLMLFILLIRGVTLPGASKGIEFYLKPNMTKLIEPQVWIDAGTQVFFSYSLCIGVLLSLGSFNSYGNNCLRDTLIIAVINSGTSILAGFAIFAALGYMADEMGVEVKDVAESGPGLAFIAYPKEVTMLPVSQLWASLFFVMIFLLGISTLVTDTLALATSLGDVWPVLFRGGKYRKEICIGCCCLFCCIVGLSMVTNGGMYVLQLFDFYGASGFALLWAAAWQCMALGWFYGGNKFYLAVEDMIGYKPSTFFVLCWKYFSPILCFAILMFAIAKYQPLQYNKTYDYPTMGHAIGWTMAASSIICVPLKAAWVIYKSEGATLAEKYKRSVAPKIEFARARFDTENKMDCGSDESLPPLNQYDGNKECDGNRECDAVNKEASMCVSGSLCSATGIIRSSTHRSGGFDGPILTSECYVHMETGPSITRCWIRGIHHTFYCKLLLSDSNGLVAALANIIVFHNFSVGSLHE